MRELMGRRSCVATPQYITCTCDLQILVHMSSSAHVVRNSAHHVCFSVRINVCGHSLTTQTEEFRTSRSTGYIGASPPVSYGAITSICRHPAPVVGFRSRYYAWDRRTRRATQPQPGILCHLSLYRFRQCHHSLGPRTRNLTFIHGLACRSTGHHHTMVPLGIYFKVCCRQLYLFYSNSRQQPMQFDLVSMDGREVGYSAGGLTASNLGSLGCKLSCMSYCTSIGQVRSPRPS